MFFFTIFNRFFNRFFSMLFLLFSLSCNSFSVESSNAISKGGQELFNQCLKNQSVGGVNSVSFGLKFYNRGAMIGKRARSCFLLASGLVTNSGDTNSFNQLFEKIKQNVLNEEVSKSLIESKRVDQRANKENTSEALIKYIYYVRDSQIFITDKFIEAIGHCVGFGFLIYRDGANNKLTKTILGPNTSNKIQVYQKGAYYKAAIGVYNNPPTAEQEFIKNGKIEDAMNLITEKTLDNIIKNNEIRKIVENNVLRAITEADKGDGVSVSSSMLGKIGNEIIRNIIINKVLEKITKSK